MKNTISAAIALTLVASAHGQTTQEEQSALTPDKVLAELMEGNARFAAGEITDQDILEKLKKTANGQFPKAVVLSCLDSRVPVELVFDQEIGDIFVGRVAGNIENEDQLGSMEFATKLAGAQLVFVLGHSGCGAVKGACDGAELGNLTALLAKIKPAVDAVEGFEPDQRNSANSKFVEKVTEQNVLQTIADIRKESPILAALESTGKVKIVGGIYELNTGKVTLVK